jgi:hypothetical protein
MQSMNGLPKGADTLADDLLQGAAEIARFFYGDDSSKNRRRIYHLIQQRADCLPIFRLGSQIYARKSSIMKSISASEETHQER